jgi:hypothetical protein
VAGVRVNFPESLIATVDTRFGKRLGWNGTSGRELQSITTHVVRRVLGNAVGAARFGTLFFAAYAAELAQARGAIFNIHNIDLPAPGAR